MDVKISFPDGNVREFPQGITGADIARSISEGLARNALAIEFNGDVIELSRPISSDGSVRVLTWGDAKGKNTFWHSSAHLMAEALEAIYPGVKLGIGPAIESGFYYDVDFGGMSFTADQIPAIEAKMQELANADNSFSCSDVSKNEAIDYFTKKCDTYKLNLSDGLADGQITVYQQRNFTELCRGPHIPSTGKIKAVKLLNIAGAYWRGDEKNKQLTRLYGITFPKAKELTEYL